VSESGSGRKRVEAALAAAGLDCAVITYPASTRTAQDAATAIGCTVGQIAKSIVFRAARSGRAVLVIASGSNRIDETRIAAALDEPLDKADAVFVRAATGFPIGGVPPCGHLSPPVVFVDRDLLAHKVLWAAAGTPHTVFQLSPAELIAVSGGQVTAVV